VAYARVERRQSEFVGRRLEPLTGGGGGGGGLVRAASTRYDDSGEHDRHETRAADTRVQHHSVHTATRPPPGHCPSSPQHTDRINAAAL